jgi:EAL domain-containing protein (putative c-di-GMP-specific phosphodiesterase class I)
LLMPADFIELAEDSGLMVPIGRWIVDRACRDTRAWQIRHDRPDLFVAVNLSATEFQDPRLIAEVSASLASSGLDPTRLILEITESVLMQAGAATVGWLAELRQLGIRLAIDDFGTGYSSLSYLERFAVDILKIDKTFVDRIGEPDVRPVLARAILQLGKALGLQVVAEGIERAEQAEVLRSLGCARGQGYLYSRPLPVDDVELLLQRERLRKSDQAAVVSAPIPIGRARGIA